MSYRECPECGEPLRASGACTSCDYGRQKSKNKALPDPFHLICSHEFQGQRCAELGTLSENTRGGGPWFCHKHFPPFAGRNYGTKPTPPPKGFQALKDTLKNSGLTSEKP